MVPLHFEQNFTVIRIIPGHVLLRMIGNGNLRNYTKFLSYYENYLKF